MKMTKKLIKLSEEHYVIVDESEIKEGDYAIHGIKWYREKYNEKPILCTKNNKSAIQEHWRKITRSTQPLVTVYTFEDDLSKYNGLKERHLGVNHIPLSEVEEAIYGYSLEKMVDERLRKCNGIFDGYKELYIDGFNAHKELVKDKLFTIEDMKKELTSLALEIAAEDGELSSCSPSLIYSWIENRIKAMLPKTEWGVEFDEQGKLKLL